MTCRARMCQEPRNKLGFMCAQHWSMLPSPIREYMEGANENDPQGVPFMMALSQAVEFIRIEEMPDSAVRWTALIDYKDEESFPGWMISECGHIRRPNGERLRWQVNTSTYPQVNLKRGSGPNRWRLIHRLVYRAWIGPIPDKMEVNHESVMATKQHAHWGNLLLVTPSENRKHAQRSGAQTRHALKPAERSRVERSSRTIHYLAGKFGVSTTTIRHIKKRYREEN